MDFKTKIYLCSHCRKLTHDHKDFLMIEDGGRSLFCSEKCIEDFYAPLVEHYKKIEISLREKYHLPSEEFPDVHSSPEILEKVFTTPNEIWALRSPPNETLYSFISYTDDFFIIALCLVFDYGPSFIFLTTLTNSPELLLAFQIGERVRDLSPYLKRGKEDSLSLTIDSETISLMENKKSTLLAELISKRLPFDIPFENFPLYETFYRETLESPEEIYQWKDQEGDELFSYIKSHDQEGVFFYYVVICIGKIAPKLLPILSFPTLDLALYESYKMGKPIVRKIKN